MIDPAFLVTALAVCLVPGTGVVYVLAATLGRARRAGLAAALGCTFGPLPHLVAAILGLAAVLHASALLYTALKWAGIGYLLWIFGFTGAHFHDNWGDERFRRVVVNAALWVAGVEPPSGGAQIELDPSDLDENLDPKTWCRFPILSGGFERELAEMHAYVRQSKGG